MARVRDLYRELSPIPCTSCRYCMPCPQGVAIPDVFELYNDAHMYDNLQRQQMAYGVFFSDDERADRCTACGECVEKCPQGIAIPEWLEKVAVVPRPLLTARRRPPAAAPPVARREHVPSRTPGGMLRAQGECGARERG